ncbi:GHKL domain-containing protein [Arsenicitalea aurantiaca]|uniref:histidine kinase n=1 Tax=Arsenicitalea aurantiaca TaxID=1783274 RepID=A0A433XLF4_9HYPH|nr:CHASE3 domain-containing protein [Arsenicitalea aurantiaca]RUT34854.1 GHKL domain-containing protein [Arsenicitalea aurantiaca]
MPISSNFFVRSTAALLVVGLLALLGILGTTLWLVEQTQHYFDEVVEAREARTATVDLRAALQDAETGQRGFILTLDERYLEPYNAARERVLPLYEVLSRVLAPYPQAAEPMQRLEQAITLKLEEIDETIALARGGQVADAVAVIHTDEGKALMDEARVFFDALIRAADQRLIEGVEDQRGSAIALRWITIIGAIIIVLVVGGSALTVVQYTRDLMAARREVEAANSGLEARVAERTADLGRANEEIQRFAYIVTHDLRAPLVNIMGFTSELEQSVVPIQRYMETRPEDDEDPALAEARLAAREDLPEAIGFIRSSTRKMDGLINAILKISREGRRPLRPERLDIAALLEGTASAIHHQVSENGGDIEIDIANPKLTSDRMSLEQVFGNLLDNAVKYRDKSRPLKIRVVGRDAPGNRIFIDVEDNGRGIAPQDHERVFELFRRSGEQSQAGEGIGLAHVRTLVRNLGGDITLTSELGVGTTFRVSLPRDLRAIVGSSAK